MQATGLFFLRAPAVVRVLPDGTRAGLWLHLVERDPANPRAILNELVAIWRGTDALQFQDAHQAELKPGRGLVMTLDRLRVDPREGPTATVASCTLAPLPPSWVSHEEHAPASN